MASGDPQRRARRPGRSIETADGEILLRTEGRRVRAQAFADIPIKTLPDGSRILLGDLAELVDGFAESSQVFEFNERPGLRLDVYQTENQRPVELAARVRGTGRRAEPRAAGQRRRSASTTTAPSATPSAARSC